MDECLRGELYAREVHDDGLSGPHRRCERVIAELVSHIWVAGEASYVIGDPDRARDGLDALSQRGQTPSQLRFYERTVSSPNSPS